MSDSSNMKTEWIEWEGGACPIEDGVKVTVVLHDGDIVSTENARTWPWIDPVIVRYRLGWHHEELEELRLKIEKYGEDVFSLKTLLEEIEAVQLKPAPPKDRPFVVFDRAGYVHSVRWSEHGYLYRHSDAHGKRVPADILETWQELPKREGQTI